MYTYVLKYVNLCTYVYILSAIERSHVMPILEYVEFVCQMPSEFRSSCAYARKCEQSNGHTHAIAAYDVVVESILPNLVRSNNSTKTCSSYIFTSNSCALWRCAFVVQLIFSWIFMTPLITKHYYAHKNVQHTISQLTFI